MKLSEALNVVVAENLLPEAAVTAFHSALMDAAMGQGLDPNVVGELNKLLGELEEVEKPKPEPKKPEIRLVVEFSEHPDLKVGTEFKSPQEAQDRLAALSKARVNNGTYDKVYLDLFLDDDRISHARWDICQYSFIANELVGYYRRGIETATDLSECDIEALKEWVN